MAISIEDIQKKQFTTRSRGYDKFEVDTFLEDIMMQMDSTENELNDLRRKCSTLYETINVYKQTEDSMKELLLLAKEKKEEIISKANEQAQEIIDAAKAKASEITNGLDTRLEQLKAETETMKKEYDTFKAKFEDMLTAQLDYLKHNADADSIVSSFEEKSAVVNG